MKTLITLLRFLLILLQSSPPPPPPSTAAAAASDADDDGKHALNTNYFNHELSTGQIASQMM